MKKIINIFKNWLFNLRLKRAISKAKRCAWERPGLYMVLNYKGKPVVTSQSRLKHLIRKQRIKGPISYYKEHALYMCEGKLN